jgi:hypothetical protein
MWCARWSTSSAAASSKRHKPKAEEAETVSVDRAFLFHDELRSIALKSFAAAEPVRSMLRGKFKDSVVRAFILGEDKDGTLELLVVHGQLVPDEAAMTAACQKLSKSIHRHLKMHVISNARFGGLTPRDARVKLAKRRRRSRSSSSGTRRPSCPSSGSACCKARRRNWRRCRAHRREREPQDGRGERPVWRSANRSALGAQGFQRRKPSSSASAR